MSDSIQLDRRRLTPRQPIFCFKQALPAADERMGLIALHYHLPVGRVLKTYYTRLDQALLLWGAVTAIIFSVAQFSYLDWQTQAIADSILTLGAVLATIALTWQWATAKRVRWVLGLWSCLMSGAIALSDYGILMGNGLILRHLCTGWLSICALGYWVTAIGMRSQALKLIAMLHLGTVPLLVAMAAGQFLLTGSVLTLSLWLLATLQWDHS